MSFHQTDQYEIIQKIGEGGMGTVYLAEDKLLERRVAIKALNKPVTPTPESMEARFQQEALALAKLNHPNITHLYAFIPRHETYWMVMEFVEGNTLEEWIRLKGPMQSKLAVSILSQLLDGLEHAHRKGIIHRDLKPANVMISADGEVKIMDFGIARIRNSQRLTQLGKSVGTLEYMAPEQIQGKEGDELTDIYAAGNILYEMLTGHTPFSSESDYQLMKTKLEERAPITGALQAKTSPELQKILATALERNPVKRFPTVRNLKEALLKSIGAPLYQDQQLMTALQTQHYQDNNTATNASKAVVPRLPLSFNAVGSAMAKAAGRVRLPALNFSKNKATGKKFLSAGWFEDNSVRVLIVVALLCIGLLTWNYLRKPGPEQKTADASMTDTTGKKIKPVVPDEQPVTGGGVAKEEKIVPVNNGGGGIAYEPPTSGGGGGVTDKTKPPADEPKKPKDKQVIPPAEEKKPEEQEPVKPEPKEPQGPVKIPAGMTIRVVLNETLSSENTERDGSEVRLYAADNIKVDGKTIIRAGAPVTGKIVDVVPSGKRKKALIGFVVRNVQATDGRMIKLHSDRFRLQSVGIGETAVYRAGMVFSVELGRGTVD